eukprot:COSAG05_NODE_882_length_6789_cov_6.646487_3_plen_319_part_00
MPAVWFFNDSPGAQMKHRSPTQKWVAYDAADCAALEQALAAKVPTLTLSDGKRRVDLKKQREELVGDPDTWRATRRHSGLSPPTQGADGGGGGGGFAGRAPPPRTTVASAGYRKTDGAKGKASITYSYSLKIGEEEVFAFEDRYSALRTKYAALPKKLAGCTAVFPPKSSTMDMVGNDANVQERDKQLEAFFSAVLADPDFRYIADMPEIYQAFSIDDPIAQRLTFSARTRRAFEREDQEANSSISGGRKQGWLWIRGGSMSWSWVWTAYWCEFRAGEMFCYAEPPASGGGEKERTPVRTLQVRTYCINPTCSMRATA